MDAKLQDDIKQNITQVNSTYQWLEKLYYNDHFANMFTRMRLNTLMSACKYVEDNLTKMSLVHLKEE